MKWQDMLFLVAEVSKQNRKDRACNERILLRYVFFEKRWLLGNLGEALYIDSRKII